MSVTFSLALEQVEKSSKAAAELVWACAFLASEEIPEELFTEAAESWGEVLGNVAGDGLAWDEVVKFACRYSLLTRDAEGRTLSIHRLVQAVVRDGMEATTRRVWAERAVRAINAMFPDPGDYRT